MKLFDVHENLVTRDVLTALAEHRYFVTSKRTDQQNIISLDSKESDISISDKIVLALSKRFTDLSKINQIEYWFQSFDSFTRTLDPHCDNDSRINGPLIKDSGFSKDGEWLHYVDKKFTISPITIAVYIDVSDDMVGGDLCISERTWLEEPKPLGKTIAHLSKYKTHRIKPETGNIVTFEGSKHYHWVDKVVTGHRKSMLINFWER